MASSLEDSANFTVEAYVFDAMLVVASVVATIDARANWSLPRCPMPAVAVARMVVVWLLAITPALGLSTADGQDVKRLAEQVVQLVILVWHAAASVGLLTRSVPASFRLRLSWTLALVAGVPRLLSASAVVNGHTPEYATEWTLYGLAVVYVGLGVVPVQPHAAAPDAVLSTATTPASSLYCLRLLSTALRYLGVCVVLARLNGDDHVQSWTWVQAMLPLWAADVFAATTLAAAQLCAADPMATPPDVAWLNKFGMGLTAYTFTVGGLGGAITKALLALHLDHVRRFGVWSIAAPAVVQAGCATVAWWAARGASACSSRRGCCANAVAAAADALGGTCLVLTPVFLALKLNHWAQPWVVVFAPGWVLVVALFVAAWRVTSSNKTPSKVWQPMWFEGLAFVGYTAFTVWLAVTLDAGHYLNRMQLPGVHVSAASAMVSRPWLLFLPVLVLDGLSLVCDFVVAALAVLSQCCRVQVWSSSQMLPQLGLSPMCSTAGGGGGGLADAAQSAGNVSLGASFGAGGGGGGGGGLTAPLLGDRGRDSGRYGSFDGDDAVVGGVGADGGEVAATQFDAGRVQHDQHEQWKRVVKQAQHQPFDAWTAEQVCAWLAVGPNLPQYMRGTATVLGADGDTTTAGAGARFAALGDRGLALQVGVSNAGHRQRILRALGRVRRPDDSTAAAAEPSTLLRSPSPAPSRRASQPRSESQSQPQPAPLSGLPPTPEPTPLQRAVSRDMARAALTVEYVSGTWLRDLGLPQFTDMFSLNGVDGAALRTLTSAALEVLGVTDVLHQQSILEGVRLLRKLRYDVHGVLASLRADDSQFHNSLPSNVLVWTNDHVVLWLKLALSLDASDHRLFLERLAMSGLHGALLFRTIPFSVAPIAAALDLVDPAQREQLEAKLRPSLKKLQAARAALPPPFDPQSRSRSQGRSSSRRFASMDSAGGWVDGGGDADDGRGRTRSISRPVPGMAHGRDPGAVPPQPRSMGADAAAQYAPRGIAQPKTWHADDTAALVVSGDALPVSATPQPRKSSRARHLSEADRAGRRTPGVSFVDDLPPAALRRGASGEHAAGPREGGDEAGAGAGASAGVATGSEGKGEGKEAASAADEGEEAPEPVAAPQPCRSCKDALAGVRMLPCGHVCLCRSCYDSSVFHCPECHRNVVDVEDV